IHEANLSRNVSLAVTRVPLHAWNEETFLLIGDLWGSIMSVDPITTYKDELEVGQPMLEKASPLFCPPLSSPPFCGKAKEESEE
ncbi:hypothetical protein U1Q18_045262, partial [Sarracenia purpurea var. burkii]